MVHDPDFVVGFCFCSGVLILYWGPDFVVKICDKKNMDLSMSNSLKNLDIIYKKQKKQKNTTQQKHEHN